jgi:hypothetical protein
MREYRRRKRRERMSSLVLPSSPPSVVRAPEPSRVPGRMLESKSSQPGPRNTGFSRKSARSTFKTALELARTFPFGVLASGACPYCYNTRYSSPGTRCSYCRSRGEMKVALRPSWLLERS